MKTRFIAGTALLGLLLSAHAMADEDCTDPVTDWQPRENLRQQLELRYGWTVQRIKVDDGCYQLRGLDRQGNAIKASFTPAALHIRRLEIRFRDGNDARDYLGGARGQ